MIQFDKAAEAAILAISAMAFAWFSYLVGSGIGAMIAASAA